MTASSTPPAGPRARSRLGRAVEQSVTRLQNDYLNNRSAAVADLARLRRGVGAAPGDDFEATGIVLRAVGDAIDERRFEGPSAKEWAAYLAFTLFAVHQQSKRTARMHQQGHSLGRATRRLVDRQGGLSTDRVHPVRRRFDALGTSTSMAETAHHARGLINQLRGEDIPLDYGLLAEQLVRLQFPDTAGRVRLAWGRDFYRVAADDPSPSSPPTAEGETA